MDVWQRTGAAILIVGGGKMGKGTNLLKAHTVDSNIHTSQHKIMFEFLKSVLLSGQMPMPPPPTPFLNQTFLALPRRVLASAVFDTGFLIKPPLVAPAFSWLLLAASGRCKKRLILVRGFVSIFWVSVF